MFYEEVFSALNSRGAKYLVVGGVAVNLWGANRMTHDLDLLVDLSALNLRKVVRALTSRGYLPRVPVDPADLADPRTRSRWIREKGMRAFSFYHPASPFQVVDILIGDRRYAKFSERQKPTSLGSLGVPLVSLEDLITMKTEAGRKQDRADVAVLRKIRRILRENTGF